VRRLQILFTAVIVTIAAAAVATSFQWAFRTRVFPLAVAVAAAAFALAHLVTVARPRPSSEAAEDNQDERLPLRESARFSAWLLGYAAGIWALGFLVAGIAVTLIYMLVERRESVLATGLMCAALAALLWGLDVYAGVGFPSPALL
jgi:hypothetical protein